ncbi:MAG: 3-deoxy-7-phosphoheptulonate synthase [Proteobacteria bacterium]|nr:3-deoxy-7-phosphoheptulonate synthase [Pseudomonadota bacterium]MCP4920099.1 3-deoxy-7-phosphoheptulonate synthase [Pseudomonadota bacterium]
MTWTPQSWHDHPIQQQPTYADPSRAEAVLRRVAGLPPLVHAGEVERLKEQLAEAGAGSRFLLQGGDCAERFIDLSREAIEAKLKILLQMSVVLTWGAQTPVVRVGRVAGQFAKPRSKPTEVIDGREVMTYRGDHINGRDLDQRAAEPARLEQAYFHSATTLNYIRALLDGGFADLHAPHTWDLGFAGEERRGEYQEMLDRIVEALRFMDAVGARSDNLRSVEFFTSHEGLLLAYEEALTRRVGDRWYNLGAHMLWIGDRTRQLDGAHVEYFRGIANPIGIKVGPTMAPDELIQLLEVLNPTDEAGRITLIGRFGAPRIGEFLPSLIEAVQGSGRTVTWSSDPMHGNTQTQAGLKTRDFDDVLSELRQAFDLHRAAGSRLAGVHFELTGEDVTECVGGPQELAAEDLSRAYETFCDPRLNYAQSLDVAFLIGRRLARERSA